MKYTHSLHITDHDYLSVSGKTEEPALYTVGLYHHEKGEIKKISETHVQGIGKLEEAVLILYTPANPDDTERASKFVKKIADIENILRH